MTEPAQNIAKTGDYGDSKFFQSICDCQDPDHSHHIIVEVDDHACITVSIYQMLKWCDWKSRDKPLHVRLWRRFVLATKFFFIGNVMVEGHHLFGKTEAARDYAHAILNAANELERRRTVPNVRSPAGEDQR